MSAVPTLIVFALSFLGMFEITLPSSFVNKIDAKSEKQGLVGVFFMALTLVLVTFSCTGPIVSSILIESAGGSWLKPIAGMFAFSLWDKEEKTFFLARDRFGEKPFYFGNFVKI